MSERQCASIKNLPSARSPSESANDSLNRSFSRRTIGVITLAGYRGGIGVDVTFHT